MKLFAIAFVLGLGAALSAAPAVAAEPIVVDRVVVRFVAPETGGAKNPQFIFERTLAFEARLEALADPDRGFGGDAPYHARHVGTAMERHIAETILAGLRIDPEPSDAALARQTELARRTLEDRAGGPEAFREAARAEGISERELGSMLRRQARASLYLDRMVAPMLKPSDAELRNVQLGAPGPLRGAPFEQVRPALARWYIGRRLSAAVAAFYQSARSRLTITLL
jgi:hypothetical protein